MSASDEKGDGKSKLPVTVTNLDREALQNALFKYVPIVGSASSVLFSTYIMHPRMFRSLCGSRDVLVFNTLWFNAHLGVGLYVYNSKHIRRAKTPYGIMYSIYLGVLFNFGSVLVWATTKRILPNVNFLRCLFGVASGVAMLAIGKNYIDFVDTESGSSLKQ